MSRAQAFQKRRWICLAAALVICVCAGFGYAWSVLQNPIVAAHGWPEGQVSLAYTVTVVCSTMAASLFRRLDPTHQHTDVHRAWSGPLWRGTVPNGGDDPAMAALPVLRYPLRSGMRLHLSQHDGLRGPAVSGPVPGWPPVLAQRLMAQGRSSGRRPLPCS